MDKQKHKGLEYEMLHGRIKNPIINKLEIKFNVET